MVSQHIATPTGIGSVAAGIIRRFQRQKGTGSEPLRLALLGPRGAGKKSLSHAISSTLIQNDPDTVAVRLDLSNVNGFSLDEVHLQLIRNTYRAMDVNSEEQRIVSAADSTIDFPAEARRLALDHKKQITFFVDNLDLVPGSVVRAIGGSFRNLFEVSPGFGRERMIGLVWSGATSLFELRDGERSALTLCEPIHVPTGDTAESKEIVLSEARARGFVWDAESTWPTLLMNEAAGDLAHLRWAIEEIRRRNLSDVTPSSDHFQLDRCCQLPKDARLIIEQLLLSEECGSVAKRLLRGWRTEPLETAGDIIRLQLLGVFRLERVSGRPIYRWRNEIVRRLALEVIGTAQLSSKHCVKAGAPSPAVSTHVHDTKKIAHDLKGRFTHSELASRLQTAWRALTRYPDGEFRLLAAIGSRTVILALSSEGDATLSMDNISLREMGFHADFWELSGDRPLVASSSGECSTLYSRRLSGIYIGVLVTCPRRLLERSLVELELHSWCALLRELMQQFRSRILEVLGVHFLNADESSSERRTSGAGAGKRSTEIAFSRRSVTARGSGFERRFDALFNQANLDRLNRATHDVSLNINEPRTYFSRIADLAESTRDWLKEYCFEVFPYFDRSEEMSLLRLVHDEELLALPLELLRINNEYLCLRGPVARSVYGGVVRQRFSLDALSRASEDIVAILVWPGALMEPTARREIDGVERELTLWCQRFGRRLDLTRLCGDQASAQCIDDAILSKRRVHFLHICCHGFFSVRDPSESGLILTEIVSARALSQILSKNVEFLFVSACSSGMGGRDENGSGYGGLVRAAIQADVSRILGYRWAVSGQGALNFSNAFYRKLFADGGCSLAEAVLEARRFCFRLELGADAWASPLLVLNEEG